MLMTTQIPKLRPSIQVTKKFTRSLVTLTKSWLLEYMVHHPIQPIRTIHWRLPQSRLRNSFGEHCIKQHKSTSWAFKRRPVGISISSSRRHATISGFLRKTPWSNAFGSRGRMSTVVLLRQTPPGPAVGGTIVIGTNLQGLPRPGFVLKMISMGKVSGMPSSKTKNAWVPKTIISSNYWCSQKMDQTWPKHDMGSVLP